MKNLERATFAGGCFWCLETAFKKVKGVVDAVSGYTGGKKENPTYEEVCSGRTGHYEAVQVTFDSSKISYQHLLEFFWKSIDPSDKGGQFSDRGSQYMTAVLFHNQEQKKAAERSKKELEKSGKTVATRILKIKRFYPAEDYHQNYSKKNPVNYNLYKIGSGRKIA